MAWKAKLQSIEKANGIPLVTVLYYEDVGGDQFTERYARGNQFTTKAQLVAYCQGVVDGLNLNLTSFTQMQTALNSSVNTDIAA